MGFLSHAGLLPRLPNKGGHPASLMDVASMEGEVDLFLARKSTRTAIRKHLKRSLLGAFLRFSALSQNTSINSLSSSFSVASLIIQPHSEPNPLILLAFLVPVWHQPVIVCPSTNLLDKPWTKEKLRPLWAAKFHPPWLYIGWKIWETRWGCKLSWGVSSLPPWDGESMSRYSTLRLRIPPNTSLEIFGNLQKSQEFGMDLEQKGSRSHKPKSTASAGIGCVWIDQVCQGCHDLPYKHLCTTHVIWPHMFHKRFSVRMASGTFFFQGSPPRLPLERALVLPWCGRSLRRRSTFRDSQVDANDFNMTAKWSITSWKLLGAVLRTKNSSNQISALGKRKEAYPTQNQPNKSASLPP